MKGRKCKWCNRTDTKLPWHMDQWGRIGWYCQTCYNCISSREERGFD
jgi:hypothetical protein